MGGRNGAWKRLKSRLSDEARGKKNKRKWNFDSETSDDSQQSEWQAVILSYRIGKPFGGSRARSCCSTLSALSISGWALESLRTKIDSEPLAPQF